MNVYAISYDLNTVDAHYEEVRKCIENFSSYCQCLESTWLVSSDKDIYELEKDFAPVLSDVDRYFITSVKPEEYTGRTYKRLGVWKWILDQFGKENPPSDNENCSAKVSHES